VVEDVVCRPPDHFKSTRICMQVQRMRCRGGMVLVGEVALMRKGSLGLRIVLQFVPGWEKFHP
jgi:hypothetical protein